MTTFENKNSAAAYATAGLLFNRIIKSLHRVNDQWLAEYRIDCIIAGVLYFVAYPNIADSCIPAFLVSIMTFFLKAVVSASFLSYFLSAVTARILKNSNE